jgi:putative redox protein
MKTELSWKNGMLFNAVCDNNTVQMDSKAPLGHNQGMTPKELVATGLGGCTAMDVIALLKKHKQSFDSFDITVDITPSNSGHPIVFKDVNLSFKVSGNVDPNILIDAVNLSQTKYCGVSAMLSKAVPINYTITLNGTEIKQGKATFEGSL